MASQFILVDFDGVLRHWPKEDARIENDCLLPANSLLTTAFSEKLLTPAIRGIISDSEWRRTISISLSQQYPESRAEQAVTEWSKSAGIIDTDVLSLLKVFKNHKLALVTNATSRLNQDLSVHGIVDQFDYIFNSSEAGSIKPEAQLYTYVLHCLGADAEDTVFIDDSIENVSAASRLGINAHQFTGIENLTIFLSDAIGGALPAIRDNHESN